MRRTLLLISILISLHLLCINKGDAQSCIPTNINGATINLACNQVCSTLVFQVAHIKESSDYILTSIPFSPLAYATPSGTQDLLLYCDDVYGNKFSLPFSFCFYDSLFSKVVVGSNGLITFDTLNSSCGNAWVITSPLPNAGTSSQCSATGPYYPRAAIMLAYSDLDPRPRDPASSCPDATASLFSRKIEWRVEGNSPCRKFVVSYFNVGTFGQANTTAMNTFQIILYESTGIIEYQILNRTTNSTTNSGRAIMGIQNWLRDKAVFHPQRNASVWSPGATNEGWRYTPAGGISRYVVSELLTMSGSVVATADTSTSVAGLLDVAFTNFCPPAGNNQYVVRTVFSACDNPANQLTSLDTISINRTNSLNAAASTTNTNCGPPSGTITVTVPAGVGTPPYTYVLDSGTPVTGPSPYTFTNVAQGPHTITVTDASGGCVSTINLTVNASTVLTALTSSTGTTCSGASNGSITITSADGTGPYSYVLDGGTAQTGPLPFTFANVPAGTHNVVVTDLSNGCVTTAINFNIVGGPTLTTTASKTDVLCNGGNTGSINVVQPTIGTAPFEYSLDGIVWQTGNTFPNLIAGTYTVFYKEANGCQNTLSITVDEPTALASNAATIPVVCNGQPNGTITVTANGGISPYQYSADGGANWQNNNIFNVVAGTYNVLVKDVNGCTFPQTITVTEPAALSAVSVNNNATCDGGNDGVITINAAGGNSSYQYSIDAGTNWQPGNTFNVAPGNYNVLVKDNLGCTTSFPTTVALTNNLTFTAQTDPVICESKSTQLQLTSNATSYTWSPAVALSSTSIANPVANPVVTTEYIVSFTLGRCTKDDTVLVNVNKAPIPDAGADGFICYGQNYQLNANGGTQYKWTPGTYLDNTNIKTPLSTPVKDVVYTLSVLTDVNGCASLVTDSMRIDVTAPIKVKTFPFDTVVYHTDQFPILAIPSDTDVINYSWSPSMGLSNPNIPNPIATMDATTFSPTFGSIGDEILYQVTASTIAGCKGEGYIRVKIYKGPDIYIPTAFSPNGDGKNDKLIPFPVGIKTLNYFRVYNRWGQLMFSTTKLHDGWDGTLGGKEQQTASFVWLAEAITEQDKIITKKGVVTLVR